MSQGWDISQAVAHSGLLVDVVAAVLQLGYYRGVGGYYRGGGGGYYRGSVVTTGGVGGYYGGGVVCTLHLLHSEVK